MILVLRLVDADCVKERMFLFFAAIGNFPDIHCPHDIKGPVFKEYGDLGDKVGVMAAAGREIMTGPVSLPGGGSQGGEGRTGYHDPRLPHKGGDHISGLVKFFLFHTISPRWPRSRGRARVRANRKGSRQYFPLHHNHYKI